MRNKLTVTAIGLLFAAAPLTASAAGLTSTQASSIILLLQAFGADANVITQVEAALGMGAPAPTPTPTPTPVPAAPHVPVVGSVYRASNLGFDYSYNAPLFPPTNFGFGLVGVSGGKSFTTNPRVSQEYNWAKFGGGAPPTLYMNLNAPYGSTVAGHVSAPESCTTTTTDSAGDPTSCAAYNYGFNAAAAALAYAKGQGATAPIWWLDIEEANSWAPDTSVNDQVIQGAIDYLNSQNIRVGIYSLAYMWNNIAGSNFTPTQTLSGTTVTTPTWVPIGINDQIGAADYCAVGASFIASSPIWLVQYEANSTAVDQNYAC